MYQKAIQDAEGKSGEGQSGEAWVLDEREDEEEEDEEVEEEEEEEEEDEEEERTEGERVQGEGMEAEPVEQEDGTAPDLTPATDEGSPGSLLSPPSIPLLRATSLQDHPQPPAPDITPSSLTRSYSLERHPPCQDLLEGYGSFPPAPLALC